MTTRSDAYLAGTTTFSLPFPLSPELLMTQKASIWQKLPTQKLHFFKDLLKLKLSYYTLRRRLGGEEVYLLPTLDLGTRWGSMVSVTPWMCSSPGERTPSTHWTEGWVGPRASVDTEARGKILSPLLGIEPWSPSRPAHSHTTTDWATRLSKDLLPYIISETYIKWY
jgi:hypothetical protein